MATRTSSLEAGAGLGAIVASTRVESGGETLVLDPLAPPADGAELWKRLDARPPTAVAVLKPDHVRDVDLFVRRYGARAFGPRLFFREDILETRLEPVEPGSQLPGGIVALYDGRGRNETPLWLPEQRALVFADALTAPGGELRVWATPWHKERALPALRALLELPFELVIVSHGEPVHTRSAYEGASSSPRGAASASGKLTVTDRHLVIRTEPWGADYGLASKNLSMNCNVSTTVTPGMALHSAHLSWELRRRKPPRL